MWQDWVNVFIGIFLVMISTSTKLLSGGSRFFFIGLLALIVLILAGMVSDKRWPEIVNVVIGAWLLVIIFFGTSVTFLSYNVFIGGFAIAVFSVGSALMQPFPEEGEYGHGHSH